MTTSEWAGLWRDLAAGDVQTGPQGEAEMVARWRNLARELDATTGRRPSHPDPLLDLLISRLTPDMTVLDIGAGVGRWTVPVARAVRRVTAIEPLAGMREVLLDRLASLGIANVTVVDAPWDSAKVALHDVAIAAHSCYTSPDLLAFVRKMEQSARRSCYLALRVPAHDGLIGELSLRVNRQWHDSPNFTVAYNLLLSAGIYANVLMEQTPVRYWTDATLEDALARAKRHLHLQDASHDKAIMESLARRLRPADGKYRWPDGMRSALVYWDRG